MTAGEIRVEPAEAGPTLTGYAGQVKQDLTASSGVDADIDQSLGRHTDDTQQRLQNAHRTATTGAEAAQGLGDQDTRNARKPEAIDGHLKDGAPAKSAANAGAGRLTPGDLAKLAGVGQYQSPMPTSQTAPQIPQIPNPLSSMGNPAAPIQSMLGAPGAISPLLGQMLSHASANGGMDGGPASLAMASRLTGDGARVQDLARRLTGTPYAWGGGDLNGPTRGHGDGGGPASVAGDDKKVGFDCSALSRYMTSHLYGVEIPRTSEAQYAAGMAVSSSQARPGDLVFPSSAGRPPGHVQIYLGNNQVLEAPSSGQTVKISPLPAGEFRTYHT